MTRALLALLLIAPAALSMTLEESDKVHAAAMEDMGRADHAAAADKLARVLEVWKKELGAESKDTALCHSQLGSALINAGRPGDARPHLEKAFAVRERLLGLKDRSTGLVLENLCRAMLDESDALKKSGKLADALALVEKSLALRTRTGGPDSIGVGESLNSKAVLQEALGRLEGALESYRGALSIAEKKQGRTHARALAGHLSSAKILLRLGRPAEAVTHLEKASIGYAESQGEGSEGARLAGSLLVRAVREQGSLELAGGDASAAAKHAERARKMAEELFGKEGAELAAPLELLARVRTAEGSLKAAASAWKQARALRKKAGGAGLSVNAAVRAVILDAAGKRRKAMKLFRSALSRARKQGAEAEREVLVLFAAFLRKHGKASSAAKLEKRLAALRAGGPAQSRR